MSYIKSSAQSGKGVLLNINTGSPTTPIWTAVSEMKSFDQSGRQMMTVDVTNTESTAKEFIATIPDGGSWKVAGNRVGADTGQLAMETAYQAGTLTMFQIQFPKWGTQTTQGDAFSFNALIEDLNYSISVDKEVSVTSTLKLSGPMTITPGS